MLDNSLNIQLLLTGNEIMSGDTVDSNSAMIAHRLAELGQSIFRKVTVGDDVELLQRELAAMSQEADVVIVNGGLGPTIDDLTAEVLAAVAAEPLEEHPEAIAHLEFWCAKRNATLNAANLKQAMLPKGSSVIPNAVGSAVGFELIVNNCRVICTPGVPSELRAMLDHIINGLRDDQDSSAVTTIIRLQTFGIGESTAQQMIADKLPNWPEEVDLGFRAGAPQMEIKLTTNNNQHLAAQQQCKQDLYALFEHHIIGEGDSQIAAEVLRLLVERGQTITTAESCTGGLIASMLTKIPGSSEGFHGGFVTYSNDIKHSVLNVSEEDLQRDGAVSEVVVQQMALGAMDKTGADYAIAVSGVAGPDGGTEDKPVGTVWLAWGRRDNLKTRCLHWPVERTLFQTMVAAAGLEMVRRMLLGTDSEPYYFSQRGK